MKSPYPYFGGKAAIADIVWRRFGDVPNYVEPFFGGGAVLLARPTAPGIETINDLNAWLCNFWLAVKAAPDAVAAYASDPVSELDLHARGDWLFYRVGVDREFVERLRGDPDYYCVRSAGWWVWGQSSWIGDGWGRMETAGNVHSKRPHLARGRGVESQHVSGVKRQLPHFGNSCGIQSARVSGQVWRQKPNLGAGGINRELTAYFSGAETGRRESITAYMRQICQRMERVRVCCGDWTRVLSFTPTTYHGLTGVFLDPPYGVADRSDCYGENESYTVAADVLAWCLANGNNTLLRIALCGYDGEHNALEAAGWAVESWKANGGYSNQRKNTDAPNDNNARERIWFSPACIPEDVTPMLFDL